MLFILKHFWTTLTHIQQKDFKGPFSQSYGFFSSHVWTWELDHKVGWEPKNRCFRTVLEKTLESPLDCKEITPVNPKSNQPWIFIGRSVAAEAPIPWVTWFEDGFTGKDSDAGKDWGQEEKGATEDEILAWCHDWWTWVRANCER